jgi:hypothetical protein
MKHKSWKRSRSARRRAERAARRARKSRDKGATSVMLPNDADSPDGLYDDCPICRAMRAAGVTAGHDGVVEMTPAQREIYEERLSEIIAEEGWPDEAVVLDGAEIERRMNHAVASLEAEGWPSDLSRLDAPDRRGLLERIDQLMREGDAPN